MKRRFFEVGANKRGAPFCLSSVPKCSADIEISFAWIENWMVPRRYARRQYIPFFSFLSFFCFPFTISLFLFPHQGTREQTCGSVLPLLFLSVSFLFFSFFFFFEWTFVKSILSKTLGVFVSSFRWMPYSSLLAGFWSMIGSRIQNLSRCSVCAECNGFYGSFLSDEIQKKLFLLVTFLMIIFVVLCSLWSSVASVSHDSTVSSGRSADQRHVTRSFRTGTFRWFRGTVEPPLFLTVRRGHVNNRNTL